MSTKLVKTATPGIYRRHRADCPGGRCDCRYVITWRERRRQRKKSYRTMAEAREGKRKMEEVASSTWVQDGSRVLLHGYATEWIESYQGTGRGYRETTRDNDRRILNQYALRYFPKQTYLSDVTPREIKKFIDWLTKQPAKSTRRSKGKGKPGTLRDGTIRNALKPLRGCLASARSDGYISHNPAVGAVLPFRPRVEDDEERLVVFPGSKMELVVSLVHPDYRLLFRLLAETGLRRSEVLGLEWKHLTLDGSSPCVRVRQGLIKKDGQGLILEPPKSKESRRNVPISISLADALRPLRGPDRTPVFANKSGAWLNPDNLYARVLRPAMTEAGIDQGGFHAFRHTVATRLFAEGRNAKQVQRWLGHSDPGLTLRTYVHLLDDDLGGPLVPCESNGVATQGLSITESDLETLVGEST